jgi:hypothetical protein
MHVKTFIIRVGYEVIMAAVMKTSGFCDIT